MKKYTLLLLVLYFNADAQSSEIFTAVPFLRINPEARSGGTGDAGIASSPDVHSIFWNSAKLAFMEDKFGVSVSYTPWLREIVNDIYLTNASAFYKIDGMQSITASFRYFDLGTIAFTNASGHLLDYYEPIEYTVHVGYARKITPHLALGLNLGMVRSDLFNGTLSNGVTVGPAVSALGDLSFYYTHPSRGNSFLKKYNIGITVSNLGQKITYENTDSLKEFLPANIGLGGSLNFQLGQQGSLSLLFEMNKLLVPYPDSAGNYFKLSVLQGAIQSLYDAPDGINGELRLIDFSGGAEYWFRKLIALRGGLFLENKYNGDRKYFTAGAGVKYRSFQLDFSYLVPATYTRNPLDNTYRLTLSFNI